jgi:hypothetical protein
MMSDGEVGKIEGSYKLDVAAQTTDEILADAAKQWDAIAGQRVVELTERVRMLELALNYVSQQQFPQPEQSYGMLVALALKGKDPKSLKALCPTCGKTYAYQGLCRDYFHQPAPVRDVI